MGMKQLLHHLLLTLFLGGAVACTDGRAEAPEQAISRGDIVRTTYNPTVEAGCYLANGRFGAVFSPLGLMFSPEEQTQLRGEIIRLKRGETKQIKFQL